MRTFLWISTWQTVRTWSSTSPTHSAGPATRLMSLSPSRSMPAARTVPVTPITCGRPPRTRATGAPRPTPILSRASSLNSRTMRPVCKRRLGTRMVTSLNKAPLPQVATISNPSASTKTGTRRPANTTTPGKRSFVRSANTCGTASTPGARPTRPLNSLSARKPEIASARTLTSKSAADQSH